MKQIDTSPAKMDLFEIILTLQFGVCNYDEQIPAGQEGQSFLQREKVSWETYGKQNLCFHWLSSYGEESSSIGLCFLSLQLERAPPWETGLPSLFN